jgi:hypothetical protein
MPDRLDARLLGLGVEPVDEQHAVEVVGLVLDARASRSLPATGDRVAVDVLAVRDDVLLAHAVEGQVGQRQAALGPSCSSSLGKCSTGLTRWPSASSTS